MIVAKYTAVYPFQADCGLLTYYMWLIPGNATINARHTCTTTHDVRFTLPILSIGYMICNHRGRPIGIAEQKM